MSTPPDSRRVPLRRGLLCASVALGLFAATSVRAIEPLLLEVSVNQQALKGIVLAERSDDGRLLVPAEVFDQARLKPSGTPTVLSDGRAGYALESVPGLRYQLDLASLTLSVFAPASAFSSSRRDGRSTDRPLPQRPPAGVYVDYDLNAAWEEGAGNSQGAALEAVAFNGWGSFSSGAVWRSDPGGSTRFRTDSYFRRDMPGRMQTLVIGDTISSAGGWSRPVRYGGVRFARDFSTAPGYITYPLPSISGSAALPSTIDILVNDRRGSSTDVPAGPFELDNVPVVNGAGQLQLRVQDLLGRETLIRQDFYVAPQLLARGLSDFSGEAGWMRLGYGSRDDHYAHPFAAGTYRRGLRDWITGEIRVELERERRAAGFSVTTLVSHLGVLGLAAGWSEAGGKRGGHYLVSAQRVGPAAGASLSWSHYDRDFQAFSAVPDDRRPREQFSFSAGARLGPRLNGGLNFTRQTDWGGERFTLASSNLGVEFRNGGFLSLSASRRMDQARGWSAGISFVLPLGRRRTVVASSERKYDGDIVHRLEASQSAPTGPGVGWRLRASDAAGSSLQSNLVFNGSAGQWTVDANLATGNSALRLGASGSVGHMKGLGFAARRIDQGAFAVVRVGDLPDVDILLSHQLVARTNRHGLALVPGLLPYQGNHLSLDAEQLPLDARIDAVDAIAVPYARSGSYLEFPVQRQRSALLVLSQANGATVPEGARVSLGPGLAEFTVLRRGEVLVSGFSDRQVLDVSWKNGRCRVEWRPGASPMEAAARIHLACGSPP